MQEMINYIIISQNLKYLEIGTNIYPQLDRLF